MLEDFFIVIQWLKHTRIRLVCVDLDSPDFHTDSESVSSVAFPDIAGTENFLDLTSTNPYGVGKRSAIPAHIRASRGRKQIRITMPSTTSPKRRAMSDLAGG